MRDEEGQAEVPAPEVAPRSLTPREEAVLVALITRGTWAGDEDITLTDDDRARWLAQVPSTRAGRHCTCGTCPSIELTDPHGRTPDVHDSQVVLSANAHGAEIFLFVEEDRLSYLELAPDSTTYQRFPNPLSLGFSD